MLSSRRGFVFGTCTRKSTALVLLRRAPAPAPAPVVGPFVLKAVVSKN